MCAGRSRMHLRPTHACFLTPGPPYLGLSRQFLHLPQSVTRQPGHVPQRASLSRPPPPLPPLAGSIGIVRSAPRRACVPGSGGGGDEGGGSARRAAACVSSDERASEELGCLLSMKRLSSTSCSALSTGATPFASEGALGWGCVDLRGCGGSDSCCGGGGGGCAAARGRGGGGGVDCGARGAAACAALGLACCRLMHTRFTHACFFTPGPPLQRLSRQFMQRPQSVRTQPEHVPQRMFRGPSEPVAADSGALRPCPAILGAVEASGIPAGGGVAKQNRRMTGGEDR
mmetsp:Transcript_5175/g.13281  ORF Transcript_5175/g.13281 Transcript_5175/m.13281 type:complete len:286 (+) Transcript_5175:2205-3062(+)